MRISGETIVSTASAEDANISVLLLCVSAWQIASRAMFRIDRRGMRPSEAAGISCTFDDPSIGAAL
jgi:hypothetical protein